MPVDEAEIDRQQAALNLVRFSSGDQEAASTLINVLLVSQHHYMFNPKSLTNSGNRTMQILLWSQ